MNEESNSSRSTPRRGRKSSPLSKRAKSIVKEMGKGCATHPQSTFKMPKTTGSAILEEFRARMVATRHGLIPPDPTKVTEKFSVEDGSDRVVKLRATK